MTDQQGFVPAHIPLGPTDAPSLAFLLHGIMGSAQNFQKLARKLREARPTWCFVLVDLRGHAGSKIAPGPHTLAECAADLRRLSQRLGRTPRVVLGHSFGGKVCLQYAQQLAHDNQQRRAAVLQQAWLLDANPGLVQLDETSEVARVLAAARSVTEPILHRGDVATAMLRHGLPERIATWMTTNLKVVAGQYRWALDFSIVEPLLMDYCRQDLWPFLQMPKSLHVHWVMAEHSDRIGPELRARAQNLPPETAVHAHVLPDSGHWVHVDNPEGLLAVLDRELPP